MSALVLVLLAVPVLGAAGAFVVPDRAPRYAPLVSGALALGWALVAADEPVTLGELTVDPLLAAAAAGLAVLVAGAGSRTGGGVAIGALVLAVGPLGAALETPPLPDRRFAAGIVLVAGLAALRLWRERAPRGGQALALLAGVVLATGLVGDDPAETVALTAAGTTVAVLAALVWGQPGRLLLPLGLLAVARVSPLRAAPDGVDWALVVVAALLAVGAAVLVAVRDRPVAQRLPLAAVLASVALLATEVAELRSAGALLGAGAVLAVASRHPVALAALLPGLAATFHVAGTGHQPEHALLGAAAVAVLVLAALQSPPSAVDLSRPVAARMSPVAAAALVFAAVPLWGWSGADPEGYRSAVAVAVAVVALVLLVQRTASLRHELDVARRARPRRADDLASWVEPPAESPPVAPSAAPGGADAGLRGRVGRIIGRPLGAPSHGTALHDAESVPEEGHGEASDGSSS